MNAVKVARALGWFSIGLGLTELVAPGTPGYRRLLAAGLERMLGVERGERILRAYGMREIVTGLALLAQPYEARWVWSRVAGDAINVATLGAALPKSSPRKGLIFALATVVAVTALDIATATNLSRSRTRPLNV